MELTIRCKRKKSKYEANAVYGTETIYLPFHTWNVSMCIFLLDLGPVLFCLMRFEKLWFGQCFYSCCCCCCIAMLMLLQFPAIQFLSFVVLLYSKRIPCHTFKNQCVYVCLRVFLCFFFCSLVHPLLFASCDLNVYILALYSFLCFSHRFCSVGWLVARSLCGSVTFSGSSIHFLIIFAL